MLLFAALSVLPLLLAVVFASVMPAGVSAAPPPFPDSELNERSEESVSRYRLVLSELKHQRADTFGERELRVSGERERSVYNLPDGVRLEEVRVYFRRQTDGQRTLYVCIGIDCGSSNFWANDVFDLSSLVSRDKDQAYFVTIEPYADTQKLTMVYISMRGGRQPKVLIDQLVTRAPLKIGQVTQDEVLASLSVTSGWLPGFVADSRGVNVTESQILFDAIQGLSVGLKTRLH